MITDPRQRRYMQTEHGQSVRAAYRARPESKVAAVLAVTKWRSTEEGQRWRSQYTGRSDVKDAQRSAGRKYASSPEGKKTLALKSFRHRLRAMGLTLEDYYAAVEAQGGACAICAEIPPLSKHGMSSLRPDHCHATGKPRGLLCNRCNLALGHLRDDPARARAAALYLEQWER